MSDLLVSVDDRIGTITLNRPERRNAFTLAMIDAWADALEGFAADDSVHVVVLSGAGDDFCAGADLGDNFAQMGQSPYEQKEALRGHVHRIPLILERFDKPAIASLGWWMSPGPMRKKAEELIARYRVKTTSPESPIEALSGGNVQRAVLARELSSDVDVLIVANPCFGLDFASVAEIRSQIMEQRNRGAAVLLVSEDLDEILELADRVAVMSGGTISYVAPIGETDRNTIGQHMAGH